MASHQFSRRTFLRGVGVTMALPWMESLTVWGDTPPNDELPVRRTRIGFLSKER